MNRTETAKCYALVAKTYGTASDPEAMEAWHLLLGDLDGEQAQTATVALCRTMTFAPRPAEIRAEVDRASGVTPPSLDAALGFYLAGEWDRHPLVRAAAAAVHWDRINAPDQAQRQFRALYGAALHDETDRSRGVAGPALGAQPRPIGELLAIDGP